MTKANKKLVKAGKALTKASKALTKASKALVTRELRKEGKLHDPYARARLE